MRALDIANAGANALSATFFSKAADLPAMKNDVVAGIKQSLNASFGLENTYKPTLGL